MIYSFQSGVGTGVPVVLLHGFCETHEIWENIIPVLSKEQQVIAVDLPGFGRSPLKENGISIEQVAEEVYRYLQSLGVEKCILIGHSLGGYVTLEMAEKHPEFVAGFALFHSTAYVDSEEKKGNRMKAMDFVRKHGVKLFAHSFVPSLFADSTHESIPKLMENAAATPQKTVLAYTEAMLMRLDKTEILKTFQNPVLIIAGDKDVAVPHVHSVEQSEMSGQIKLLTLNETGHMGMYESIEQLKPGLLSFLDTCRR